jgi:1,4-alpha-glucan branching enzyme
VGATQAGAWREALNTDAARYGGSNVGNSGRVETTPQPHHGRPCSLSLTLPPLAIVLLVHEG